MHTLLHFKEEALAEYLNSALRRHGLDSYVFNTGVGPDGEAMFSIVCPNVSELGQARFLIYSSRHFLRDIHPEAARELLEIRRQNRQLFLKLATSRPALVVAALAMAAAVLGYLFGL
ncbi:hypothetical protein SAMN05216189_101971 [Pseudomonas delhiensis]|uniref:Uncharacterized protein n=1 Tax=Pseudomonas delhiensis TaxID=366289 RepID=A0A239I524_9PSED|nr:hypothetical protein [Pseudomonas delhiensis]SDJ59122.1 hypothetical protein SAMN05216189_101971 [Pseudomonas delhiensis]SNS88591.1 hypothetical protein SAMN06295949_10948 [Pseudomonas delhiensis]